MAGTTNYPGAVDTWTDKVDDVDDALADDVNDANVRVIAVQTELGTNPSGSDATVAARLDALDTTVAGKLSTSTASGTYATLASPALTGNPTAPTPAAADNDTSIATTAFVQGEIAGKASTAAVTAAQSAAIGAALVMGA